MYDSHRLSFVKTESSFFFLHFRKNVKEVLRFLKVHVKHLCMLV